MNEPDAPPAGPHPERLADPQGDRPPDTRGRYAEILLVLGVSLGASAIWSILQILERLTRPVPLGQQTTTMNPSVTPDRPWLDLAYQLVGIGLALVPVGLALYLLARVSPPVPGSPARWLGLDLRKPAVDLGGGLALAAFIGIPGLGLYAAAKALGFNTQVAAANLTANWWTVPVLVLAAVQAGVLEEVVVVGYLLTRLEQAGWRAGPAVAASALIRGTYHLYQGFGGFVGNVVMGVVFALVWRRTRRVGPLVVAHTAIDVVAFVGYTLLKARVGWL